MTHKCFTQQHLTSFILLYKLCNAPYMKETRQRLMALQTMIVAMFWTRIEPGFGQYQASSAELATKRGKARERERPNYIGITDSILLLGYNIMTCRGRKIQKMCKSIVCVCGGGGGGGGGKYI